MAKKPTLKINSSRMTNDFKVATKIMADEVMNEFIKEFEFRSHSPDDKEVEEAKITGNLIRVIVTFYADAIMDSYGTGVNIDTSNPYLANYKSSGMWNPVRSGLDIVGREEGSYINIYGESAYSSGRMAGKSLSNLFSGFRGISPSFAIQRAENWMTLNSRAVNEIINKHIRLFIANCSKYFTYN